MMSEGLSLSKWGKSLVGVINWIPFITVRIGIHRVLLTDVRASAPACSPPALSINPHIPRNPNNPNDSNNPNNPNLFWLPPTYKNPTYPSSNVGLDNRQTPAQTHHSHLPVSDRTFGLEQCADTPQIQSYRYSSDCSKRPGSSDSKVHKQVEAQSHSPTHIENFYESYDAAWNNYFNSPGMCVRL